MEGCPDGRNVWTYIIDPYYCTAIQLPSTEGVVSLEWEKKEIIAASYGYDNVSGLRSRQITARDVSHVLVENNYDNYEYDVLLTVIKDGDTYKIDSLKQEKSE